MSTLSEGSLLDKQGSHWKGVRPYLSPATAIRIPRLSAEIISHLRVKNIPPKGAARRTATA